MGGVVFETSWERKVGANTTDSIATFGDNQIVGTVVVGDNSFKGNIRIAKKMGNIKAKDT